MRARSNSAMEPRTPAHETPGRRAGVDTFAERDERHVPGLPLIQQEHEVPEVAAQTIEPPADDPPHAVTPHVVDQPVERGTPVSGTTDAMVHILRGTPPIIGATVFFAALRFLVALVLTRSLLMAIGC
jgi:hypothetical protein